MANSNPITKWLISRKELFKLSFTQYGWPEKYLPTLHDFTAEISMNGISCQGRGTDTNAEIAIEKAAAEAIERYLCKILKMDSIGFSVSGSVSALEHAKFEALERYCLNRHLHLNLPFHRIDESNVDPSLMYLIRQFEENSSPTFVSFHQMHTSANEYGVVCFIEDTKLNIFSFGFAYDDNLNKSLKRSLLEAIPNFAAIKENETSAAPLKSSQTNSRTKMPWHLDREFYSQIVPLLFESKEGSSPRIDHNHFEKIEFEILKSDISILPELDGCPIDPVKIIIKTKRLVDEI